MQRRPEPSRFPITDTSLAWLERHGFVYESLPEDIAEELPEPPLGERDEVEGQHPRTREEATLDRERRYEVKKRELIARTEDYRGIDDWVSSPGEVAIVRIASPEDDAGAQEEAETLLCNLRDRLFKYAAFHVGNLTPDEQMRVVDYLVILGKEYFSSFTFAGLAEGNRTRDLATDAGFHAGTYNPGIEAAVERLTRAWQDKVLGRVVPLHTMRYSDRKNLEYLPLDVKGGGLIAEIVSSKPSALTVVAREVSGVSHDGSETVLTVYDTTSLDRKFLKFDTGAMNLFLGATGMGKEGRGRFVSVYEIKGKPLAISNMIFPTHTIYDRLEREERRAERTL